MFLETIPQCDENFFKLLANMCEELLPSTSCILITLGNEGVFVANSKVNVDCTNLMYLITS